MPILFTRGSAAQYETILYGRMTPSMAAQYLRENRVSVRSFSQTLRQMYPGQDLEDRLENFFKNIRPSLKASSVKKKIQNWLCDKNLPSSREDYYCIAFALGLGEEQLSFLLGMCTDYAIQYRDGREAVLAWFLRHKKSYREALVFLSTLPALEQPAEAGKAAETEKTVSTDKAKETEKAAESGKSYCAPASAYGSCPGDDSRITHELRDEFRLARSMTELRDCYLRNLSRFGKLHLRSYYYFEQYLELLGRPLANHYEKFNIHLERAEQEEPDYSIEAVMNTYLSLHMPVGKNYSNYNLVQRLIKENWPNATSIINMKNRIKDVPRKLLLLMYVVTEDSGLRKDYWEMDEDYIPIEERVEDHWWALNGMLADCGMAPLDLRNAFDWLILYAIAADGEETMSGRLEMVVDALYDNVR